MSKRVSKILVLFMGIIINIKYITAIPVEPLVNNYYLNTTHPIYTTSIERFATFSNGCYKQRITEPDLWNSNRFFQTEQLVCPPTVNATTFAMLTQQLQLNSTSRTTNHTEQHFLTPNNTPIAMLPPSGSIPANNFLNVSKNVPHVPHVATAKPNPAVFIPPPAVPSTTYPLNSSFNHQQSFIPAMVTSNATSSRAAILSKKTGFYGHENRKNSAQTINYFNCCFVLLMVTIIFNN